MKRTRPWTFICPGGHTNSLIFHFVSYSFVSVENVEEICLYGGHERFGPINNSL